MSVRFGGNDPANSPEPERPERKQDVLAHRRIRRREDLI